MKSELDIKMLLGTQLELLKTHEQECNDVRCTSHIVISDRLRLLNKILED